MPKPIFIYNSLTRQKEEFKPQQSGKIKMYACGVTTYDYSHMGHALQAVFFDVIRNYFEYAGFQVTYVRNHTDVDDKIIQRAKEKNIRPDALAETMVQATERDILSLGVRPATHEPRVSKMISDIIQMIENLIQNEFAYVTKNGDVYFRVRKKDDYGKLSGRKIDELMSGSRELSGSDDKEDALDFALWKIDATEGASWQSPWGVGRPGWHIECSAMAKTLLGSQIDIHGGGRDLIFPHHENEIAQSEGANGCSFAQVWMHNGLLMIEHQKMSKSLGNHLLIRDAINKWHKDVIRFVILSYHYSSNVDFTEQLFRTAEKRMLYYYSTLEAMERFLKDKSFKSSDSIVKEWDEKLHDEMRDDFNTPKVFAVLNLLFKKVNESFKSKDSAEKKYLIGAAAQKIIFHWGKVLGLFQENPQELIHSLKRAILKEMKIEESWLSQKIMDRIEARKNKNFALADQIRQELTGLGLELMDTVDGTDWTIGAIAA